MLPYVAESLARGVRFRLTRRLPTMNPLTIWPDLDDEPVVCRPMAGRFGNLKQSELLLLCALARRLPGRRVFEFGTFDGQTTWHLAANAPEDARVYTLDLPADHAARRHPQEDRNVSYTTGIGVGEAFVNSRYSEKIEQIYCDSCRFEPGSLRGTIDLCLVDACHEYEHVRIDTENALAMVRPGGVILWHDYSRWWPGVQRCLDELAARLPVFRIYDTSLGALVMPE